MRSRLLLLAILLIWPSFAFGDLLEKIAGYRAEIRELSGRKDALYEYDFAGETMAKALSEAGAVFSLQHAGSWGGWLYLDWSSARNFYVVATERLAGWGRAVESGRFDEVAVDALLAAAMVRLRTIDEHIELWFRDNLKNAGERGYLLDQAHSVGCCSPLYEHYRSLADHAYDDSIGPNLRSIGDIRVIPEPPAEGADLRDERAQEFARASAEVEAATQSGELADMRQAVTGAAMVVSLYPGDDTAEVADVLRLLDERLRYQSSPVDTLIEQALAQEPGPLRDALLKDAENALLDRIGHLTPLLAAGAEAGTDEERASVLSKLLAEAHRLAMLRDDVKDPFSPPSGLLRAVSGLKAAAGILDIADNGDATAKEFVGAVNDLAGSFKLPVSPTAPFAAPAGVVVAQLDQTVIAYGHATDTLSGLTDAIAGDAEALERVLHSAEALEEALSPRTLVAKLTDGFLNGAASNLPFVRTIIGWFKD